MSIASWISWEKTQSPENTWWRTGERWEASQAKVYCDHLWHQLCQYRQQTTCQGIVKGSVTPEQYITGHVLDILGVLWNSQAITVADGVDLNELWRYEDQARWMFGVEPPNPHIGHDRLFDLWTEPFEQPWARLVQHTTVWTRTRDAPFDLHMLAAQRVCLRTLAAQPARCWLGRRVITDHLASVRAWFECDNINHLRHTRTLTRSVSKRMITHFSRSLPEDPQTCLAQSCLIAYLALLADTEMKIKFATEGNSHVELLHAISSHRRAILSRHTAA